MKLGRNFYCSWYLVVLGSLWPLLFLGVKAETTAQYESTNQDVGSGEVQDFPGNVTSDEQVTSGQNTSENPHHYTQENQTNPHLEKPKDHFIWSKDESTYSFEGQALSGHVMVEYGNAYLVTQCSDRCMRHVPECKSYNYQKDTHSCQLNSRSDLEVPEDLINVTSTTYYRTTAFQTNEVSTKYVASYVINV